MKEYIFKSEYDKMILEYNNFKEIYDILKVNSLEVILDMDKEDIIVYFSIASNDTHKYITFYTENEKNVLQILIKNNTEFFTLFGNELIEELNIKKSKKDGFNYRVFDFKFLDEPELIKQIFYNKIEFENTKLMKEIIGKIEYYKDKIIEDKKTLIENDRVSIFLKELKDKYGEL